MDLCKYLTVIGRQRLTAQLLLHAGESGIDRHAGKRLGPFLCAEGKFGCQFARIQLLFMQGKPASKNNACSFMIREKNK